MENQRAFTLILILSSLFLLTIANEKSKNLEILMPDAVATHVDDYLCTSFKMDPENPSYITAFNPAATSKDAHHILLFGCSEPGSMKKIWNCGEMSFSDDQDEQIYESGPTCSRGSTIIYAWAMDAEKTELPKDVAFKVGGSTSIKYLVLQVHYSNLEKFQNGGTDQSGLILSLSPTPLPRTAGILLLSTDGAIRPGTLLLIDRFVVAFAFVIVVSVLCSLPKRAGVLILLTGGRVQRNTEEVFEVACRIDQDIEMHPFAFRTHAHKLGLVNSGYRVRGNADEQEWTEIGRRSPQLPQMFYPTESDVTIKRDDFVAAVCTMYNFHSRTVRIGSTGNDEMCNFYMMYWVDGDNLLKEDVCSSAGPPRYYFGSDPDLNVEKIPSDAFRVPPPPNGPAPGQKTHGSHHMMSQHEKPHRRRISSFFEN